MTSNPLAARRQEMQSGDSSRELKFGEERVISIKDKDGSLIENVVLTRTDRKYVYDLCDAYNSRKAGNPNVIWSVGGDDSLRLNFAQDPKELTKVLADRAERERQDFNHRLRYPVAHADQSP